MYHNGYQIKQKCLWGCKQLDSNLCHCVTVLLRSHPHVIFRLASTDAQNFMSRCSNRWQKAMDNTENWATHWQTITTSDTSVMNLRILLHSLGEMPWVLKSSLLSPDFPDLDPQLLLSLLVFCAPDVMQINTQSFPKSPEFWTPAWL